MERSPSMDPAFLSYLRQLWDPDEPLFLTDLLATFLSDADNRLSTMRQAVATGDARSLVRAAHALQGASASMGAQAVAELCGRFAVFQNTPLTVKTGELVSQVEKALARVKVEVEQLDRSLPFP